MNYVRKGIKQGELPRGSDCIHTKKSKEGWMGMEAVKGTLVSEWVSQVPSGSTYLNSPSPLEAPEKEPNLILIVFLPFLLPLPFLVISFLSFSFSFSFLSSSSSSSALSFVHTHHQHPHFYIFFFLLFHRTHSIITFSRQTKNNPPCDHSTLQQDEIQAAKGPSPAQQGIWRCQHQYCDRLR